MSLQESYWKCFGDNRNAILMNKAGTEFSGVAPFSTPSKVTDWLSSRAQVLVGLEDRKLGEGR